MRKHVLMILGLVLASIVVLAQLSDVPKNHWAYESVKALVDRGLIIGYPDGTFKGKQALTRYEFAVFSWRVIQYIDRVLEEKTEQLKMQCVSPADFERLSIYVEALANKIGQLQEQLGEISKVEGVYAYKEDVERLDTLVETLAKKLGELYGTVSSVKEDLAKLTELSTKLGELESKLGNLVSAPEFEKLSIRVEALEKKIEGVSEVQGELDEIAKEITLLKMNDDLYENDISELYRTTKIISRKVDTLEDSFKDFKMKAEADILSNSAKIMGVAKDVASVKRTAAQKSELERVNVILDVLSRKMVDLEEKVSALPDLSGYEDVKKTVEDLQAKSENFLSADEYYESFDYVYSELSSLQEQFDMVAEALDILREDVNAEIEEKVADQSEINDLFNNRLNSLDLMVRGLKTDVSAVKQDVASLRDEIDSKLAQAKEETMTEVSATLETNKKTVDETRALAEEAKTTAEEAKKAAGKPNAWTWINLALGITGVALGAWAVMVGFYVAGNL